MDGQSVDTVTNAALAVSALTLEQRIAGLIILVWSLTWKGIALWQSARSRQKWWFILILIVNMFGLLELLYLFFFYRDEEGHKTRFDFQKVFKFGAFSRSTSSTTAQNNSPVRIQKKK